MGEIFEDARLWVGEGRTAAGSRNAEGTLSKNGPPGKPHCAGYIKRGSGLYVGVTHLLQA